MDILPNYEVRIFLWTGTSIFFVKIHDKIVQKPLGIKLRSAGTYQIFRLVLWPRGHEDISG